MRKNYKRPSIVIFQTSEIQELLTASNNFKGAGVGSDIEYGGEDENGTIDPSVKRSDLDWPDWI